MVQFELTRYEWLFALLAVPTLFYFFYRSLSDFPRRQRWISLITRTLIIVLLVLALSGLTLLRPTAEQYVVFLVDESVSVGEKSREAIERLLDEAEQHRQKHRVGYLAFANEPHEVVSERPERDGGTGRDGAPDEGVGDAAVAPPAAEDPARLGTDIASAIEAAAGAMSPAYVPHIVLLSDGNQTRGDALRTALRAGIPISVVPLETRDDPEVQVSEVQLPAQVREGEPFHLEVVVDTNQEASVLLQIYRGAHEVASETKQLVPGENRFTYMQSFTGERLALYTVRVTPLAPRAAGEGDEAEEAGVDAAGEVDTLLDNNSASGLVYAAGKPRVLIVESDPALVRELTYALEQQDIEVHVRPATGMPDNLSDLQNYELLVLSNVPATDLTQQQMEIARTYVQDLGGGFLMLGGDQSFGLGGYYKSVIEDILPVRSDFEKEKQKPNLGMAIVIDKSGSMSGDKIEMAKSAARAAVELLGNRDRVGLIAFDGGTYLMSEMQPATNKGRISDDISRLDAGGGTNMYPAMEQAYELLRNAAAKLKHVIILTDGVSAPGDFEGLAQQMASERMTVSTVAIGSGAHAELLEEIARVGRGRYYFTDDPSSIPQIFAKETVTASKSAINEQPFIPLGVRQSHALRDIDVSAAPFLLGYVVTRPKPTCELILATEQGDPLLAWWRYGLGMSAAFTSDTKARWAAEWLTWPEFGKFWAQIIRHTMRKSEAKGVNVEIERQGPEATVTVDAIDAVGRFLNQAETEVTVIDPQLNRDRARLVQTAPGRYVAEFPTPERGAYHLELTQQKDGQVIYRQSRGLVVGYQDELRLRPTNDQLLQSIASVSGGRYEPTAAEVFAPWDTKALRPVPLWPYLLVAAVLLLVVDVALRRIDFSLLLPVTHPAAAPPARAT